MSPVLNRILAKKELVVGTAASMPPLNMSLKDGTITGMEIDLARMLAAGLEVQLTVMRIPFNDLLGALEAGQVDMILSGMTITLPRNAKVAFAGPYFISGKSILTTQVHAPKLQSSEQADRPDVTLVALKGSTSQYFAETLMPRAKLVLAEDYDQAVGMIIAGTAHAMVADYPICRVSVYRYPGKGLTTSKEPLTFEPIGIALPPSDPLLLNLVQNLVNSIRTSGELDRLTRKWFENPSWVPRLQ
jgi:polar amino acid transport system substrate-binding protein